MKTIALIQARMSSSRFPGKVLLDISGQPMLLRVIERAKKAKSVGMIAVITSTHEDDNAIEMLCKENDISCFRGSLDDVLDRYYQAAIHFQADIVIRLTADCPLLDAEIIDKLVQTFHKGDFDYVSNTIECTYPDGLDTEVFKLEALTRAWKDARLNSEREHVTAYIYKHPELFRLGNVKNSIDLSPLRWTVDTPEDMEFMRAIYAHFENRYFDMSEILTFLKKHPEIARINAGQLRNEGYSKSLKED